MNRYFVELTYPKAARLPLYAAEVDAQTQTEAVFIAETQARRDGWKVAPLKRACRLVKAEDVA